MLRLLEFEAEALHVDDVGLEGQTAPIARLYGSRGQGQAGIDVYAQLSLPLGQPAPDRRHLCLQARRTESVTATKLKQTVQAFLTGRWAATTSIFIYATSAAGTSAGVTDAFEEQARHLAEAGIEFRLWDQEDLSRRLQSHPRLVDDFFGRAWTTQFCGQEAVEALGRRMDASEVHQLRRELRAMYEVLFSLSDSGLLSVKWDVGDGPKLSDRFVCPDLLASNPGNATSLPTRLDADLGAEPRRDDTHLTSVELAPGSRARPWVRRSYAVAAPGSGLEVDDRVAASAWIGREHRQVVIGDPGAGKSTLLRYLVLELLSDQPTWLETTQRFGDRLPVWFPFHYFTQRLQGSTGAEASVGSTLRAWLEQLDLGRLWPLIEKALNDDRLLLVVDGLDEWVSDGAGRDGAAAIERFVNTHDAAVIVSTRPYGLSRLALASGWTFARIAGLSAEQQRTLARTYFRSHLDPDPSAASNEIVERQLADFGAEVDGSPDLRSLSPVPLFLVLLIAIKLSSNSRLPDRRFEVYDRALQLLFAEHPHNRRAAAAVTASRRSLSDDQARDVLAHVAYLGQVRGDVASTPIADMRRDIIESLRDPETLAYGAQEAASAADLMIDILEGELGILVRTGPQQLGFLHRVLQEQLAAQHIANRMSPKMQRELVLRHIPDPLWREVILALVWKTVRPAEQRELVSTIAGNADDTAAGIRARELLAEVVFGGYRLPQPIILAHTVDLIAAAESHPFTAHRARLVDAAISGLDQPATAETIEAALRRWTVNTSRPSPYLAWQIAQVGQHPALAEEATELLLRCCVVADMETSFLAARGIAALTHVGAVDGPTLRASLLRITSDPVSGSSQAAALAALALAFPSNDDVIDALSNASSDGGQQARFVALAHQLGALAPAMGRAAVNDGRPTAVTLDPRSSEWLASLLTGSDALELPDDLVVETYAKSFPDGSEVYQRCLVQVTSERGLHETRWNFLLRAFKDNKNLVDFVVGGLRAAEEPNLLLLRLRGSGSRLARAFAEPSSARSVVAAAIEHHVSSHDMRHREIELHEMATIDQGTAMREALLHSLRESSHPHWAASALATNFVTDEDALSILTETLRAEPSRASQIANVAGQILGVDEAIALLVRIVHGLAEAGHPGQARADIVVHALISCTAEAGMSAEAVAALATELLPLLPDDDHPLRGRPQLDLAIAWMPAPAAADVVERARRLSRAQTVDLLRAYRNEESTVRQLLPDVEAQLRVLTPAARARLCTRIANGRVPARLAYELTMNWADEEASENKSVASLVHHASLIEAKRLGHISAKEWTNARQQLRTQAAIYGPDHEARRRAAWVGVSVLNDWTLLDDLIESIGEPRPVTVTLSDPLSGTDLTLAQQLAEAWDIIQHAFSDHALERLAGRRGTDTATSWGALARVSGHHPRLEADLEQAVALEPSLLEDDDVLTWFVSRPGANAEAVRLMLLAHLKATSNLRGAATHLLGRPEVLGIARADLLSDLEDAARFGDLGWGNPALEVIAFLWPQNELVVEEWTRIRQLLHLDDASEDSDAHYEPHPQTYLAVAWAVAPAALVPWLLSRDLEWIDRQGAEMYEPDLIRHATNRLRNDPDALTALHELLLEPLQPLARVATVARIVATVGPLDPALALAVTQRLETDGGRRVATMVRDRLLGDVVSVRTELLRIVDVDDYRG